jgi:hypothetical protein
MKCAFHCFFEKLFQFSLFSESKLVVYNCQSDFKMLGITREYLKKELIAEFFDFAEIYFQCSLWDVVYYYCNKKRIQEYDDKERANGGYNIEIGSRYTLIAKKLHQTGNSSPQNCSTIEKL